MGRMHLDQKKDVLNSPGISGRRVVFQEQLWDGRVDETEGVYDLIDQRDCVVRLGSNTLHSAREKEHPFGIITTPACRHRVAGFLTRGVEGSRVKD